MSGLTERLEAPLGVRGRWIRVVAAVLMAALATAIFAGALAWRAPVVDQQRTAAELEEQAGQVLSAVFSAQAASWQADREAARNLVTGSLATAAAGGFEMSPPAGVRSVRWEPVQVGVVAAEEDSGTALAVVNVVVTDEAGAQTVETKSVSADFVRSGERWLLNALDELQ